MRTSLLTGLIGATSLVVATPLSAVVDALTLAPLVTPPAPINAVEVPAGEYTPYSHGQDRSTHLVPDSYIVVFKDGASSAAVKGHHAHVDTLHAHDVLLRQQMILATSTEAPAEADLGGRRHHYDIGTGMRGYAGKFSAKVVDAIRARPEVAFVERDSIVWASDVEKGAPWGLARLSHRKPLSFGTFSKYEYEHAAGEGVDIYVIDTGVNIKHADFEGRARWGKTIPLNDADVDANGHGSHVAGTCASTTFGVAKHAHIIAVKVLGSNGSGTMSDVIAGVDWAASSAKKRGEAEAKKSDSKYKGSVANMSLGGGKSPALDLAVNGAVDDGLNFAVAAGNDNQPACNYSPAAATKAITVGASTIADDRAYFSNHGSCVDIFAPGLNIKSVWNIGNNSINTISGTSMASPHIAGLAAYLLSLYPETFVPTAEDWSVEESTPERVQSLYQSGRQFVFGKVNEWTGVSFVAPHKSPKKDKTLSPAVLKSAMIRIASKGMLKDLPAGTIDKLAFNNYTQVKTTP